MGIGNGIGTGMGTISWEATSPLLGHFPFQGTGQFILGLKSAWTTHLYLESTHLLSLRRPSRRSCNRRHCSKVNMFVQQNYKDTNTNETNNSHGLFVSSSQHRSRRL